MSDQRRFFRSADGRVRDARGRYAPSAKPDRTGRWHDAVTGRFVTKPRRVPTPKALPVGRRPARQQTLEQVIPALEQRFRRPIEDLETIRARRKLSSIRRIVAGELVSDKHAELIARYVERELVKQLRRRPRRRKAWEEAEDEYERRVRALRKRAGYEKLEKTASMLGISVETFKEIVSFFHLES